ncbi:hypothetical protein DRH14_00650 [Candidatus Shapirobacteria bacterium]|nr:MAG: hypothetical protein DRH14_00650 [Candidatus Shapirobacteria bacterium]
MKKMILSKSNHMLFLRHLARLWLKKFDKSKLPSMTAEVRDLLTVTEEQVTEAKKVLELAEAGLEHREYLHQQNFNPIPALLKQLKQDIG